MIKKLKITSLFALLLTLTCFSCRDDDEQPCIDAFNSDCPNYDPCLSVMPARANNIVIIDSVLITFSDTAVSRSVDTLGTGSTVYFRPVKRQDNASYEWQIGTDPRLYADEVVDVDFIGFTGDVEVRLVTSLEDSDNCLVVEDRVDTSYAAFYVDNMSIGDFPSHGTFTGSLERDPNVQATIEVYRDDSPISTRIRGFPIDCYGDGPDTRLVGGYDWFVTTHHPFDFRCRELTAIGRIRENDHRILELDYTYVDDDGNTVEERFVGYRQ